MHLVLNRIAMQADYMDEIWDSFSDVRAVVPLFETEIRGTDMLARTADVMFAQPVTAGPRKGP